MSVGLIAGGPGEERVLRTLARKVLGRAVPSARTRGEGELFVATRVKVIVRNLMDTYQVRKAVVCVDSHSDNQATHERAKATRQALAKLWGVRTRDLPVEYVIIVHELEGWLLADEEALRAVLGRNAQVNVPRDLESHCRQPQLLEEIFRKNGRPDFQKTKDNLDIANGADPKEIAKRMPSFREFVSALR